MAHHVLGDAAGTVPVPRRRAAAGTWGRGLALLAAALVILLILAPLLALLVQTIVPGLFQAPPSLAPSAVGLQDLLADPYALRSAVDSLGLATVTAVVATGLGTAVACALVLTDMPGRRAAWSLTWLLLISPSFLIAQGWELLLAPGGLAHGSLGGWPAALLLSPAGVAAVLTLKLFPFATLAVASALEGQGADLILAARLAGARWGSVLRRILLPLLLPALLSGGLIVFAEVLSDFGIAATLAQTAGFPLLTFSIYSALDQFPANFAEAAAASLLLILTVSLGQGLQTRLTRTASVATRWGGRRSWQVALRGPSRILAPLALGVLFALAFGVPAAATVAASLLPGGNGFLGGARPTVANYSVAWRTPYGLGAFGTSFGYALLAASAGVLFTFLVALAWRERQGLGVRLLQVILTGSIAVPGIVLGAGYIFLWNAPGLRDLAVYGTPAGLWLAYVAGGLPYGVRVVTGSLAQIPASLLTAARVAGATLAGVLRWVLIPVLGDTWLRVWLLLFSGVMFELPVSELLYPPGEPTLAVAIVHQFHSQQFGVGAALTVTATVGVGCLVAAAAALFRLRPASKSSPQRPERRPPDHSDGEATQYVPGS
jgi:iron(III) transport system permease protein